MNRNIKPGDKLYHVSHGKIFTVTIKDISPGGQEAVVTVNDDPKTYAEMRWHLFSRTPKSAWKSYASIIRSNLAEAEKDVQKAKKVVSFFKKQLAQAMSNVR